MYKKSVNPTITMSFKPFSSKMSGRVAFHIAGHATAIYLGNKQKGMEPVFFQIRPASVNHTEKLSSYGKTHQANTVLMIEGGRMITLLPDSLASATASMTCNQKFAYEQAFFADIINLLAGPLAEAKYVAMLDNEVDTSHLANLKALNYYDGDHDLEALQHYFDCFNEVGIEKEKKIIDLYIAAYTFVNNAENWKTIKTLANHLLSTEKNQFDCDEIISVLENNQKTKCFVN